MIISFLDTETFGPKSNVSDEKKGTIYDVSLIFAKFLNNRVHNYNLRNLSKDASMFEIIDCNNYIISENVSFIPKHKLYMYKQLLHNKKYQIKEFKDVIQLIKDKLDTYEPTVLCGYCLYNDLCALINTQQCLKTTNILSSTLPLIPDNLFKRCNAYKKCMKLDLYIYFTKISTRYNEYQSKYAIKHNIKTFKNYIDKRLISYYKYTTNNNMAIQYHISEHCNQLCMTCLSHALKLDGCKSFPCNLINIPVEYENFNENVL